MSQDKPVLSREQLIEQCKYLIEKAQECEAATAPAYEPVAIALLGALTTPAALDRQGSGEPALPWKEIADFLYMAYGHVPEDTRMKCAELEQAIRWSLPPAPQQQGTDK